MHSINLTPTAINDIQEGLDFYNSRADNLGFRFADEVDNAFKTIAVLPTAFAVRYKNVRAKQVKKFPYLIFYTIKDTQLTIEVLRIFNSYQEPFWRNEKI